MTSTSLSSSVSAPPVPGDIVGLTAAEVAQRVAGGQTNAVEQVTSRPLADIIKANVFTRFNALLGGLLVLVLATGSFKNALFGIALVFNSVLGIAQEWAAKRKLDSLAVMHAPQAIVLRDQVAQQIPSEQVVRGDTVALRAGDQVPADGVVLASDMLEIDESNLTGESDAVDKTCGDQVSSGTAVVAGSGWFRADVVGAASTAHQLASEARKFTRAHSDVQHSTNVLLKWLTWVVIVLLPITLWSQWRAVGDLGWQEVVLRSAAAMVGLVPEGLVVLTTLAFLLAAVQLTRQQALIQELPAVEGLARVDVICVDKTGTLTQGTIAFESIELVPPWQPEEVTAVLGAMVHDPDANQTAQAIAAKLPASDLRVTGRVPFSSARKWSGAEVAGQAWLLGAPDVLLTSAATESKDLLAKVATLADDGRRVLLLAQCDRLPEPDQPPTGLVPAALVELSEVVRPDAADTLDFFRGQGVRVVVISGDTPRTVAAVGRRVGLDVGIPVDARTLPDDPDELADLAEKTTIFGRVSPAQKRALVRALQSRGHVVAMTGDGVNDVLALKDADIGIAMGNGAQATKAVAQLVLLDSSFSHLPNVLAQGRRVIGNVERVASLFVTKNVMSAVTIVGAALFSMAYPFLPSQLTLLSTVTIGIPAAVLALGPNPRRYQPGFLRRVLTLSIPAGVTAGLAAFGVYSWLHSGPGVDTAASTGALTAVLIVFFALLIVLARPPKVWKVVLVVVMMAAAVGAYVLPIGRDFFTLNPTPLALQVGLIGGLIGAVVVELAYRWSRRQQPPPGVGQEITTPTTGRIPGLESPSPQRA